jgi:hypothetical protein
MRPHQLHVHHVQGLSITGAAMATMELARVDASCATFYLVHTFLAMLTIALMVRRSSSLTGFCKADCRPAAGVPPTTVLLSAILTTSCKGIQ